MPVPSPVAIEEIALALADAFPSRSRHPVRALEEAAVLGSARRLDLRAALFRFVDVAPACRSNRDRAVHLSALLHDAHATPPAVLERGAGGHVLGGGSALAVRLMARRFIAGRDPRDATPALARLWGSGQAASVDLLGESTVTAAEADRYAARCADALASLAQVSRDWPARPRLERDSSGALPRVNLSIKVSALTAEVRSGAPERGVADALPRVLELARTAHAAGAHLHLDMESFDSRGLVMGLLAELLERCEPDLSLGIVLQAYLRDSSEQLDELLELAARSERAIPLTVRLVKGAYWDHEAVDAEQHGWRAPTFTVKAETDRNFELLSRRLLEARPLVRVAIASHNLRSVAHAIAASRALGADDGDLEIQVLRGLGDDLGTAVGRLGLRARVYTPVGSLIEGMAYLVRRLLENTSNDSFLAARAQGEELNRLVVAP